MIIKTRIAKADSAYRLADEIENQCNTILGLGGEIMFISTIVAKTDYTHLAITYRKGK